MGHEWRLTDPFDLSCDLSRMRRFARRANAEADASRGTVCSNVRNRRQHPGRPLAAAAMLKLGTQIG